MPDRLFDDGTHAAVPQPWQGRHLNYERRDGMTLPGDSTVEWLLPQGAYAYWRAGAARIDFDYAR